MGSKSITTYGEFERLTWKKSIFIKEENNAQILTPGTQKRGFKHYSLSNLAICSVIEFVPITARVEPLNSSEHNWPLSSGPSSSI